MPHPRLLAASLAILLVAAASITAVALAASDPASPTDSKGRPLSEITPSTPLDASADLTAISTGSTRTANRLDATLARYNSGELNYLDLPLLVNDQFDAKPPYTLEALVEGADTILIGTVASLRWETEPIGGSSMTVVTYRDPINLLTGDAPTNRQVRSRFSGPVTNPDPQYWTVEHGVRERVGETYLVFASKYGDSSSSAFGGFIPIDGDRIANSEPARALGIEDKKVSDVIAEIRRLKPR